MYREFRRRVPSDVSQCSPSNEAAGKRKYRIFRIYVSNRQRRDRRFYGRAICSLQLTECTTV